MPLSSPRILASLQLPVPVIVTCKLEGEATRNTTTNLTTVPTPSCAEEGDYQFIHWGFQTNGTPDYTVSDFGQASSQWKFANWSSNATALSLIMFRKIVNGHQPFVVRQTSGAYTIRYCTYILKGQILDYDPIIGHSLGGDVGHSIGSTNTSIPRTLGWSPTTMAIGSPQDVVIVGASQNVPSASGGLMLIPPEDQIVLGSDRNVFVSGSAAAPNHAYVVQKQQKDPYINLNGNGHPLDGWTPVNVTINLNPTNIAQAFVIQEQNAGTNRYGIYKDFYLEAGKTYDFTFDSGHVGITATGANETCTYLGYVDPNNIEHGVAANESVNAVGVVGTNVTVNNYIRNPGYDNNGFGGFRYATTLRINAAISGIHRLWVSFIIQSQLPSIATSLYARTGNTARAFRGCYLTLHEIKNPTWEMFGGAKKRNNPTYRDATFSDRLLTPNRVGNASHRMVFLTFRGTAGKRPVVEMGGTAAEHLVAASPSPSRTVSNSENYPYPSGRYHWEYSNQPVHRGINEKFYFEVTLTAAVANQWFGYIAASGQCLEQYTNPASTGLTQYFVASSTQRIVNNTTTSGLPAWSTNDVIGFLLNLTDNTVEVTQNGVAWTSMALSTDPRAAGFMYKVMASRLWNGAADNGSRYILNLRGPFQHKPVGAVAFDFDNEIT